MIAAPGRRRHQHLAGIGRAEVRRHACLVLGATAASGSQSPWLTYGTLIGAQWCEPGTTRVGPLSRVIVVEHDHGVDDPPVVGELLRHVDMQVLLAVALDRVAQIGAVHLDLAEKVVRRRQDLRDLEAAVEGGRLVEDVGEPPRPRLDMHLVPALPCSAPCSRSNSARISSRSASDSTFSTMKKPSSSSCRFWASVSVAGVTPSSRSACLVYMVASLGPPLGILSQIGQPTAPVNARGQRSPRSGRPLTCAGHDRRGTAGSGRTITLRTLEGAEVDSCRAHAHSAWWRAVRDGFWSRALVVRLR